jgi:hypothetical protein
LADEGRPPVWGLWNAAITEWFNPGTAKPYFTSREAAARLLPLALRQYPLGKWEIREYPLEEEALDLEASGAREGPEAAPALQTSSEV